MSLKAFHIVFIALSTALAAFYSLWSWHAWQGHGQGHGDVAHLVLALASFAAAVGLPIYGAWFLKKMKQVRWI